MIVAVDLGTTMDAMLGCMVQALETAGRPVAKSGLTVGPAVLGPSVCCQECDDCGAGNGQLSLSVQRVYPVDASTMGQQDRFENCKPGAVAADLAFVLARCHPVVRADLEPPTLDEVAPYADGAVDDVQIMWNTFACPCEDTYKVVIRDLTVPEPQGGCSGVGMVVSVLIRPQSPTPDVS